MRAHSSFSSFLLSRQAVVSLIGIFFKRNGIFFERNDTSNKTWTIGVACSTSSTLLSSVLFAR